jgi:hypothetical protein
MIDTASISTTTLADCNTLVVSIENVTIVAAASFGTWLGAVVSGVLVAASGRTSCRARIIATVCWTDQRTEIFRSPMDDRAREFGLTLCDERFDIYAQCRLVELESALIVDTAIEVLFNGRRVHRLTSGQSAGGIMDQIAVETCLLMLRGSANSWIHV